MTAVLPKVAGLTSSRRGVVVELCDWSCGTHLIGMFVLGILYKWSS